MLETAPLKKGFMLIEVVIAVALLAIGSLAIINLQINTLSRVAQAGGRIERVFKLQNVMCEPEFKKTLAQADQVTRSFESKNAAGFDLISYKINTLKNQELQAEFPGVHLVQVQGTWQVFGLEQELNLFSLIYLTSDDLSDVNDGKKNDTKTNQDQKDA